MISPNNSTLTEAEIKSLVVRERYYRDTCQWEKLRNSYHPDPAKTHIEITWFQGDIDGFVAGSKGMARGGTAAVHQIFPVEVYLNGGNKALTESTGSISIRFSYEGAQYDCVSSTRFISRLENVGGEWKLLTLDAIYDRDSITPVLPRAPVDFPFPPGARESYKCIAWVLSQKGFAIKDNLPGNDSPASCEQLMKEGFEWLLE